VSTRLLTVHRHSVEHPRLRGPTLILGGFFGIYTHHCPPLSLSHSTSLLLRKPSCKPSSISHTTPSPLQSTRTKVRMNRLVADLALRDSSDKGVDSNDAM
jgi:hypothetical protein